MFRQALFAVIVALLVHPLPAAVPTTCTLDDPYSKALCAYQRRQFDDAAEGFGAIVDTGAEDTSTIRSAYFLARTEMKRGRYAEAGKLLIRIYSMDKAFYDAWSCDYLLGECRRATGKD
jgi:TolA-binding protein